MIFPLKMKAPNSPKLYWSYRSASQDQLEHGTADAVKFKPGEKMKNWKCYKLKPNNYKSETNLEKKEICLENPDKNGTESKCQLIPIPKTPKQPKETLRRSLSKLKSSQLNEYAFAIRDIVQISRFHPQLLVKSMAIIYKGLTTLITSLRITTARMACQAANELFMNIQYGQTAEFDELIHVLLQKVDNPNKELQKDALEALNSMIIHVPPSQSIKTLLHKRIACYSLSVRTTASKLLACVLDNSDTHSDTSLNEDTKTRLVFAAMRFLQDDCYDIKFHGMRLLTMLLQHKDFDKVFQKKVSVDILHRVNKIIENVKVGVRHGHL